MQLLLKQTVAELGRVGDLVTVKPGFARNYLLPRGLAVPVTKANMAQIEKARLRALAEERARVESLKELAAHMADVSVTIEGRANEDGHLFGSVSAANIAAALKSKSFPIETKNVRLEAPLKEIGVFDVEVHLHADVNVMVKVWVVQAKPS
jgi:large subunit ribosomal protein L9